MKRHAVIHLPPLSAEEASHLLVWLERASTAVWRAHGSAIVNYRLCIEENTYPHPFDDDDIPCFCPRHPGDDDDDEVPW